MSPAANAAAAMTATCQMSTRPRLSHSEGWGPVLYHPDVPSKLFSCFLLVVALACAARAQDGVTPPTLRGVVVDQHGAPVEGARVSLLGAGAVDAVVVSTDAGGRFAFGP